MMTEIYACLCGIWANLSTDSTCVMGPNMTSPVIWWEENAKLYSPVVKPEADTMYHQDFIHIRYHGAEYRIHPMFIQVVSR